MSDTTIGRRIAELRRARKWTQYDLAAGVGVQRWTVGRWEASIVAPNIARLVRLADALDTSADYLLGRKAQP